MTMFVTVKTRDEHLHIRLKPSVKDELKIVADARGMTMSGLVYSMIVKAIREEKNVDPQIFQTRSADGMRLGKAVDQGEISGGELRANRKKTGT